MSIIWESTSKLLQIKNNINLEQSGIVIFEKADQVRNSSKMTYIIQKIYICSSVNILLPCMLPRRYESQQKNPAV